MNKIIIKHFAIFILVVAIIAGFYFAIKTVNKYKKAVEFTYQKMVAVQEFLKVNFPDQVKSFDETVAKQLQEAQNEK